MGADAFLEYIGHRMSARGTLAVPQRKATRKPKKKDTRSVACSDYHLKFRPSDMVGARCQWCAYERRKKVIHVR